MMSVSTLETNNQSKQVLTRRENRSSAFPCCLPCMLRLLCESAFFSSLPQVCMDSILQIYFMRELQCYFCYYLFIHFFTKGYVLLRAENSELKRNIYVFSASNKNWLLMMIKINTTTIPYFEKSAT